MATAAILLNTTYKLANSEYAIALRVIHERKTKYYSISTLVTNQNRCFKCSVENWKAAEVEDNGLGKLRKNFLAYKECNTVLESKLSEAQKILQRYEAESIMFTFDLFESDLKRKE